MHANQFIWEGQRRARLDEAAGGLREAARRRAREAVRQLWRLWSTRWFPLGWIDRRV